MEFKITIAAIVILTTVGIVIGRQNAEPLHAGHPPHTATVYKTATCGCCANYVAYLRTKNFTVEVIDLEEQELTDKKRELGVPASLDSCHTTVATDPDADYFIEGHIPYEVAHDLIDEKLDIAGIGMPGMPSASPGMPGNKTEPFNISQVAQDGTVSNFVTL